METMMAPWRYQYITGPKGDGCPFCAAGSDRERLVLFRGMNCYVMLNAYPYATGHLMVLPFRHVSDICDLREGERTELMELVCRARGCLCRAFHPQGMNVGINLGASAGAGVAGHLHCHLVPRWAGDSNFMQVLSGTSVVPLKLAESWELLKKYWE